METFLASQVLQVGNSGSMRLWSGSKLLRDTGRCCRLPLPLANRTDEQGDRAAPGMVALSGVIEVSKPPGTVTPVNRADHATHIPSSVSRKPSELLKVTNDPHPSQAEEERETC